TEARASMIFKTIPFGRSGIPPEARLGPASLDAVEATQWDEHLGHCERSVGTLVVLEQEHERAPDGACSAVERVHELRAALAPKARAKPPGREVRVVRAGCQLAVPAFGRQPHLDVVLLRRGRAELLGRAADDAVRQA